MSELFENLDRLRNAEGKVAVATLVNTRGTTPRKEGAKMLVGEDGRVLGSVTIGGCVDAQVIEESASVLAAHTPRLLELNLGDEDAWEIGLTCGGTIEVFVEPVDFREASDETLRLYERLRKHADGGGRGALLTRLDPPDNGAKLLVLDTGEREGGLGSAALDERSTSETQGLLRAGKSTTLTVARPHRRLQDHRDRWPASLRHARALPGRGRAQDRHPLGAGAGSAPRSDHRAGPGGPRLQVRPARAEARAPDAGRLHRPPRLEPARQGHPRPLARGWRRRGFADPGARAHRPRPRRPGGARDRAGCPGRGARCSARRDLPAHQRKGQEGNQMMFEPKRGRAEGEGTVRRGLNRCSSRNVAEPQGRAR